METRPSTKDDAAQKILFEESPNMLSLVNESFRPLASCVGLSSATDVLLVLIGLIPFLVHAGGWSLGLQSGCVMLIAFVAHIIGAFVSYGRRPQVIYSLSHDYLTSEGGLAKNNFKLPISEIDEVISCPRSSTRTDIFVYAKRAMFVMPGMRTRKATELIALLPERLQEGDSEKFQAWLESLVANLQMDDNHRLNPIDIRKSIDSELAHPENVITLNADSSKYRKSMFAWLILALIGIASYLISPKGLFFIFPLLIVKGISCAHTVEKMRDCMFIYTDNALFEIDCKRRTVSHYARNQAELKSEKTDDGNTYAWVGLKKGPAIPFKVDNAAKKS